MPRFILLGIATAMGMDMLCASAPTTPAGAVCAVNGGWYDDRAVFDSHRRQLGLTVETASWMLEPHSLPPNGSALLDDGLDISTHALNPGDPWLGVSSANLWPESFNNVRFSANTMPLAPLAPRGNDGLILQNSPDGARLGPAIAGDSFVLTFESPINGRCQAFGMELAGPFNGSVRVTWLDGFDVHSASRAVTVAGGQTLFLGSIHSRITQVELWDFSGNPERLASLNLYRRVRCADCGGNDGLVGIADLLGVIGQWGQPAAPCDLDGDGVGIADLLLVIGQWNGQCVDRVCAGENPSMNACGTDPQCFPGVCSYEVATPATCLCNDTGVWQCAGYDCGHCH